MHPLLEQFIKEDLLDDLHELQDHNLCPNDILDTVYFFIEDFVEEEVNRRLDEMDDIVKDITL
jgi:hypothetical protein